MQVYPIYRSTNGGTTWSLLANVAPSQDFPGETLTSQPYLYEVPQQVGGLNAGDILLAGNIMATDRSTSRIVVYRSTDRGASWSLLSTVDTGGPAIYDPSPGSTTTTTIWEPSIELDATGNQSGRPGMIMVDRLPDGRYLAVYEVVNRPSLQLDTAPIYFKWRLQPVGPLAIVSAQSGKVADVTNCASGNGTDIRQWEWLGSACQEWTFTHTDNGHYQVRSLVASLRVALAVLKSSRSPSSRSGLVPRAIDAKSAGRSGLAMLYLPVPGPLGALWGK